jgi:tetratricopeptide (TPR) repeat protein
MKTLGLIIGISIVMVQAVSAKSPVEVNRIAKAITVKINGAKNQGSGVLLQRQGNVYTVLTAAHVLKGESFTIATFDDRQYPAIADSGRKADGDVDLAVIKFQSNLNYQLVQLGDSNQLEGGMNLYVAGFPSPTEVISQSVFVFRPGLVTANSNKVFDRGYALLYSNDTLPGMSGGPILNENGQVVGIHGRGDHDQNPDPKKRRKTGFNAGIPITRFLSLAKSLGVFLPVAAAPPPSINRNPKADDYFVAAYQYSENGDSFAALQAYNQAIAIDPKYAIAYNNRGVIKEEKFNDVSGALADYNQAIMLQPRLATAYHNRGNLKRDRLQDFKGALADYNQAIMLDNSDGQIYYNRGLLYKEYLIEADAAISDFRQAARLFREQDLTENLTAALNQLQELDATE